MEAEAGPRTLFYGLAGAVILVKVVHTFRDRPELHQSPTTSLLWSIDPNVLLPLLCRTYICRIRASLQPGLTMPCLQVEVISMSRIRRREDHIGRRCAPMPRTHRDDARITLLNLGMGHIRAKVRTIRLHYIYLVSQVLRGYCVDIGAAVRKLARGEAEEDE